MSERTRIFQAHLCRIPRAIEKPVWLDPESPPDLKIMFEWVSLYCDSHLSGSHQIAPNIEKWIGIQPALPSKVAVVLEK
jgi:hypothetical protein